MATVLMAGNLWITWIEVSLQHTRAARAARDRLALTDEGSDEMGRAIHEEYLAGLVAVPAAAFAIDAWYIAVKGMIPPPGSVPMSRHGWVTETLKSGFEIGSFNQRWPRATKKLFQLRDDVAHFESTSNPSQPHASQMTNVSRENTIYSAEEAESSARHAVEVVSECLRRPRANLPALKDWCDARSHVPDFLEEMRDNTLSTS